MSRFIYCYAECHYAECHYAECRYAECRYAGCRGAEMTAVVNVIDAFFQNKLERFPSEIF